MKDLVSSAKCRNFALAIGKERRLLLKKPIAYGLGEGCGIT